MNPFLATLLGLALTIRGGDQLANDAGLGDTAAGRLLLKYTVQCALPSGDALKTKRKGAEVILHGSLGLAPDWKHEVLSVGDQRWMTACILARMNAFGVTVKLSIRGHHDALRTVDEAERQRYTFEEGAFYGNLFADPPELYACSGAGGARRAATRRLRVCTDPAAPGNDANRCGMTMTGACADVCETRDGAYVGCLGNGRRYDEVLSVFLDTVH